VIGMNEIMSVPEYEKHILKLKRYATKQESLMIYSPTIEEYEAFLDRDATFKEAMSYRLIRHEIRIYLKNTIN
jgi:hypothetical protein